MTIRRIILGKIASAGALAMMMVLGLPAQAAVEISSTTTKHMSCSGGVCAPTAANAVLNVADLEKLLASGATTVTTTGSGAQADDIVIQSSLTWTSVYALTLDSYRSILIEKPVSVEGVAGLNLNFDKKGSRGSFEIKNRGDVIFSSVSSTLAINGAVYVLVDTVQGLASAVAGNPNGNFALSKTYDASADGTYSSSPVETLFYGKFEGLGNQIQNLSISETGCANTGLFSDQEAGLIADIGIVNAKILFKGSCQDFIGALVGVAKGEISDSFSSGSVIAEIEGSIGGLVGAISETGKLDRSHSSATVSGNSSSVGGLIGQTDGRVGNSYASGSVSDSSNYSSFYIGGLAGDNGGTIDSSFSTGLVDSSWNGYCGGLVGITNFVINNSYSTGSVSCGADSAAGGFVGAASLHTNYSYSTGSVTGSGKAFGGFAGIVRAGGHRKLDYWNTTTSGKQNGTGYGHKKGITGLTTEQLQSGLPAGFSAFIWVEDPKINNGFPYLITNPPPK